MPPYAAHAACALRAFATITQSSAAPAVARRFIMRQRQKTTRRSDTNGAALMAIRHACCVRGLLRARYERPCLRCSLYAGGAERALARRMFLLQKPPVVRGGVFALSSPIICLPCAFTVWHTRCRHFFTSLPLISLLRAHAVLRRGAPRFRGRRQPAV